MSVPQCGRRSSLGPCPAPCIAFHRPHSLSSELAPAQLRVRRGSQEAEAPPSPRWLARGASRELSETRTGADLAGRGQEGPWSPESAVPGPDSGTALPAPRLHPIGSLRVGAGGRHSGGHGWPCVLGRAGCREPPSGSGQEPLVPGLTSWLWSGNPPLAPPLA